MPENNAYILGTDKQELHRLGIQHQVWSGEAQLGWKLAKFTAGQTLLDLGSGPGFCTKELAYIVGDNGKVIGIDKSPSFIHHLEEVARLDKLNIEAVCTDFDRMQLQPNSLDGMYCRWGLAWIPNPKEILEKVRDALKQGGRMIIHEYYDWSTLQTEPPKAGLAIGIAAALKSFKDTDAEIDIGRELPGIFDELGMKVTHTRLMPKLATPKDLEWQWPKTFFKSYFPRLADLGSLTQVEVRTALKEFTELENTAGATICCPLMIEVIAEKK